MSKSKLLKEAIADAKAVRSTALLNAKAALEEAFTPKLQSMISAKMMQEMDDEEMEGEEEEMDAEMDMDVDVTNEDEDLDALEGDDELEDELEAEDDMDMDADVDMDADAEMDSEVDAEMDMDDEEDLELEAIIRELEGEDDMDSEVEMEDEVEDEVEDEMTEELESSEIENDDDLTEDEHEDDIDINEIIAALREDDSMSGDGLPDGDADADSEEEEDMTAELEEAYKTIKIMRNSLNETNLLNAKLLFSNKLFKSYDLNESQKLNVIDNFDRAQSLREVKLVYTTLAESMKRPAKRKVNENASRVTGTTAPKKQIISESNKFSSRMQKLAGLKK